MIKLVKAFRSALPLLALALVANAAWSASYRWTDAAGIVHYGDQPPVGVEAERLLTPAPPPLPEEGVLQVNPEAAQGDQQLNPEASQAVQDKIPEAGPGRVAPSAEALKLDQQRQAQEKRQRTEVKRQNCQAARTNLEALQRNKPLRLNDPGTSSNRGRRVSDEERAQMTREAQKQIRENCN